MKIELLTKENDSQYRQLLDHSHERPDSLETICSNPFRFCYLVIEDQQAVGYIDFSIMYEHAELNQIFVLDSYRKRKIATKLMNHMLNLCKEKQCENITLEVRIDNHSAISLYEKFQFQKIATRKNYYRTKDAWLMERKM